MRMIPLFAVAFTILAAGEANAQTATRLESVKVRAGVAQKIAFYPAAKRDCTRTPLPEIRLIDEPRHGRVIVQRVSIKATADSACPGQTIPGQLIMFIANPGYQGRDSALYAVRVSNHVAQVKLDVEVAPRPMGPRPGLPNRTIDL